MHTSSRLAPAVALSLLLATTSLAQRLIDVDPALPSYDKTSSLAGNLNSIGSDTLNNLMTYWAEGFRRYYPSVNVQVEGKGSSTAPTALTVGTSQLGPMSRKMKVTELEDFEDAHGYRPTAIGVALDSLAVYVHRDNPVPSLSLPEVDAMFSSTRRGGLTNEIRAWRDVDVPGRLGRRPLSLYGRNSASGTYGYFKKVALFKGDFKSMVKEQPGSASVVMGVGKDIAVVGYSGIGYKTSDVRVVPLSKKPGGVAYDPTYENVLSGRYPLGRMLYVYVDKDPNEELPPMVSEFLKYMLSQEGQRVVVKDGYLPLTPALAARELAKF